MRLIDADALIKAFNEAQVEFDEYYKGLGKAKVITDNVPTVEYPFYSEAYQTGYEEGKNERPQGDSISREALKSTIIEICGRCSNIITKYENGVPDGNCAIQHILNMIDNAPTVKSYTLEDLEKAKTNGYKWGRIDGKKEGGAE